MSITYGPRSRNRSTGPEDLIWTLFQVYGGTSTGHYSGSYTSEATNDVVVPHHEARLNAGEIINNPFSTWKRVFTLTPGIYRGTQASNPSNYFQYSNYPISNGIRKDGSSNLGSTKVKLNDQDYNALVSRAKQRCLAAVDSTPFRFGEDFLETSKAINTLRRPLEGMRKPHDNLRDALQEFNRLAGDVPEHALKSVRGAVKLAESMGSAWLSARYAYGSLVYTGLSLSDKAIWDKARLAPDRPRRRKATASDEVQLSLARPVIWSSANGTSKFTYDFEANDHISAKARIIYRNKWAPKPYNAQGHDWGLRLKDMPRAAFQVLPITWFSDRLFNVSDMIQGAMNYFDPNVELLAASITIKRQTSVRWTLVSGTDPVWIPTVSGSDITTDVSTDRVIWIPTLSDVVPVVNGSAFLEPKNAIDTAAITLQSVGKILRSFNLT